MSEKKYVMGSCVVILVLFLLGSFLPLVSVGQEDIGPIHGYVYSTEDRTPVAGASIFLRENESVWYTNEKGDFVIPDVEYGIYNITVYAKGFNVTTVQVTHSIDGTYVNIGLGREIYIPAKTGFVTGRVFLEAEVHGHDAGDAVVYVQGCIGASPEKLVDVSVTDDPLIGCYVVELPAGDYDLSSWAYSHHVEHSGTLSVPAGLVTHYDFYLEMIDMHNSGLAGNVTDSDTGNPVNNATVIAYNNDYALSYFTLTDTDGFYFFTGPREGNYTIVVFTFGYDPGSCTGEVLRCAATYLDISLYPNSTPTINCSVLWGFVYGDGYPTPVGNVFTDYGLLTVSNFMGIPGMYHISCFPAGVSHEVGAWAPGFYPVEHTLTVPFNTVVRHDFYLQGINNITSKWSLVIGNVFMEGTTNPINGAEVHLDGPTFSGSYPCGPSTNFFWFNIVPPGTGYYFNPVKSGYTYTGYSIGSGLEQPPGTPFTINPHSVVIADVFMERVQLNNNTMIWGYVYQNFLGGSVVPGVPVKLLIPSAVPPIITTTTGYYSFNVAPGLHSLTIFFTGYSDIYYMDHLTGVTGLIPWMGTVASGTSRHVDFVIKQGEPVHNCSIVAGQVIDIATGDPVDDYEVKIYPSSGPSLVTQSGSLMAGTGMFQFCPICSHIPGTWHIDGYDTTFTYDFEYLEYYSFPAGTPTTSPVMFTTYTLPTDTILWFNIYVNRTQDERNTTIWGYLYLDGFGGPVISGETVKIISPPGSIEMDTDSFGMYLFHVSPGTFTVGPVLIYPASVTSYDHLTTTYSMSPWTGSVALGDSRHVDFIMKQHEPTGNASAISGIVVNLADHTPVSGFYVKAYPEMNPGGYPYLNTHTNGMGMFHFGPLSTDLDQSWLFSGDDPLYTLDHVEYHLLASGAVTTEISLPVYFNLPNTSIMWVEIHVNKTDACNGIVFGKVYKLYSCDPAVGAQVSIFDISAPTTPIHTQTLGADGLYTFDVASGTYIVKTSLSGYVERSATVTIVCHEDTYQPFYLPPRIDNATWGEVVMRFVSNSTGDPAAGYEVEISGLGHFKTDDNGKIAFKLPGPSDLIISVTGAVVVAITTDDEGEELVSNDDGTVTLEPGRSYTVKFKAGSDLASSVRGEEGIDLSTFGMAGIIAAALLLGVIAGYLLKRRPNEMSEE